MLPIVTAAISKVKDQDSIQIRVHPDDYETVLMARRDLQLLIGREEGLAHYCGSYGFPRRLYCGDDSGDGGRKNGNTNGNAATGVERSDAVMKDAFSGEVYSQAIRQCESMRRSGRVTQIVGLVIESQGPNVNLGDLCYVSSRGGQPGDSCGSSWVSPEPSTINADCRNGRDWTGV